MPLDFPSNPVDGQVYDNYYWDQVEGIWRSSGVITPKIPAGVIHPYAGATAPNGYLLCSGQEVEIFTYSELYAALTNSGTVFPYGTNTNGSGGAGSTHFRIPDLRGDVVVGKTASGTFATLGSTGGSETHTLTVDQMPSHTHIQDAHNHTQNSHNHTQNSHTHSANSNKTAPSVFSSSPSSQTQAFSDNEGAVISTFWANAGSQGLRNVSTTTATNQATTATNQATTATNQNTGGGQAHNNLQPYIVLNYIIKT